MTFDNGVMVPTLALAHLDQKVVEIGAHLVTLDTLPHFYGGNEIVCRDVTRFISQLEALGIARECGLLSTATPRSAASSRAPSIVDRPAGRGDFAKG